MQSPVDLQNSPSLLIPSAPPAAEKRDTQRCDIDNPHEESRSVFVEDDEFFASTYRPRFDTSVIVEGGGEGSLDYVNFKREYIFVLFVLLLTGWYY
jgi:hypothetical protein